MDINLDIIRKFYDSFAKGDAEGMASCYHEKLKFQDPAFGVLNAQDAKAMWSMLLSRGRSPEITYHDEWADDESGKVIWEARYEFGPQKRKVHNRISAKFKFENGLIIEHTDSFDFWRWSRMALGMPGLLLGWTPIIQNKVRKRVLGLLAKYKADKKL
ncbi:MAG: nuclear transport factor 2 family protein [Cyclobacteriaceae bacterium]